MHTILSRIEAGLMILSGLLGVGMLFGEATITGNAIATVTNPTPLSLVGFTLIALGLIGGYLLISTFEKR